MTQHPRARVLAVGSRRWQLSTGLIFAALVGAMPLQMPADAAAPTDVPVTNDGQLTRHDGGIDRVIAECSDPATDPAGDNIPADNDLDSNDGGNRLQSNEPAVAIDPTNPNVMVAAWNDYCSTDLEPDHPAWMGMAFSTNRGATWTGSLLPGYPGDDSTEGAASVQQGRDGAGDPVLAFDNDGRLFVGGIVNNAVDPTLGDVFVSTYGPGLGPGGPTGQLPKDYLRTVRVGQKGTPAFNGLFQDKPMVQVDRSTTSPHEDNVYFCWTRFNGPFGAQQLQFSRSTDHGVTFSRPLKITNGDVIGCDIAVERDGDVYVSWMSRVREGQPRGNRRVGTIYVARSGDGGRTFGRPRQITQLIPYGPRNAPGVANCGDGSQFCPPEGFVYHRGGDDIYRLTADPTGQVPGVYAIWNAVDPATIMPSQNQGFYSAGTGHVGRSVVYVAGSFNNGATWSNPVSVDPSPGDPGHQYFPDIDAFGGRLVAMWQDNRTDDAYDVQLPIGNEFDAQGRAVSSGTDVVATYAATSIDGVNWTPLGQVSSATHQPNYEMYLGLDLPFQGDYNWTAIADGNGTDPGGLFAYMVWTDNRNVVPGVDPREGPFVDGFDVHQCNTDDLGFDTCANAGGQDQDIYGTAVALE